MSLFRLLYCSRAKAHQSYRDLTELLSRASARNEGNGITGLLCFGEGYFFQCLEGPQTAVSETIVRINRDERHCDILLIDARVVGERAFPEWSMRLVTPKELSTAFFRRLYEESVEGSADRLLELMKRLTAWSLPQKLETNRPEPGDPTLLGTKHGHST